MHVKEQFAASVLVDDVAGPAVRVYQMPMPVVKIHADVFAEIAHPVLDVQIVGGVVERDFDRSLKWSLSRRLFDGVTWASYRSALLRPYLEIKQFPFSYGTRYSVGIGDVRFPGQ